MKKFLLSGLLFALALTVGCKAPTLQATAEAGDAEAQFTLGQNYLVGNEEGFPRDAEKAVHWFRLAAEQGHAEAQHLLGQAYLAGEGGVPEDRGEGLRWLRKAAEQGNTMAQWDLAIVLFFDDAPYQNQEEARVWFQTVEGGLLKLAEEGNAEAQYRLGMLYVLGEGVPKDKAKARQWLQEACNQGIPEALNALYLAL